MASVEVSQFCAEWLQVRENCTPGTGNRSPGQLHCVQMPTSGAWDPWAMVAGSTVPPLLPPPPPVISAFEAAFGFFSPYRNDAGLLKHREYPTNGFRIGIPSVLGVLTACGLYLIFTDLIWALKGTSTPMWTVFPWGNWVSSTNVNLRFMMIYWKLYRPVSENKQMVFTVLVSFPC